MTTCRRKGQKQRGAHLIEYAILAMLIAVAAIPSLMKYGRAVRCEYCYINGTWSGDYVWTPTSTAEQNRTTFMQQCVASPATYSSWCK